MPLPVYSLWVKFAVTVISVPYVVCCTNLSSERQVKSVLGIENTEAIRNVAQCLVGKELLSPLAAYKKSLKVGYIPKLQACG